MFIPSGCAVFRQRIHLASLFFRRTVSPRGVWSTTMTDRWSNLWPGEQKWWATGFSAVFFKRMSDWLPFMRRWRACDVFPNVLLTTFETTNYVNNIGCLARGWDSRGVDFSSGVTLDWIRCADGWASLAASGLAPGGAPLDHVCFGTRRCVSRFDIDPHKQVPKVFWPAINNLMSLRDR